MASDSFVRVRGEYSMRDGAACIGPLVRETVKQVVRSGMPANAATDHGNTVAAFESSRVAKEAGIKPIIGI